VASARAGSHGIQPCGIRLSKCSSIWGLLKEKFPTSKLFTNQFVDEVRAVTHAALRVERVGTSTTINMARSMRSNNISFEIKPGEFVCLVGPVRQRQIDAAAHHGRADPAAAGPRVARWTGCHSAPPSIGIVFQKANLMRGAPCATTWACRWKWSTCARLQFDSERKS